MKEPERTSTEPPPGRLRLCGGPDFRSSAPPRGEAWNQILDQPGLLVLTLGGSETTAALLPHLSAGTGIRFWARVATSGPRPPPGPRTVAAVPLGRCRRKRRLVWTSRRRRQVLPPCWPRPLPFQTRETVGTKRARETRGIKRTRRLKRTQTARRRKPS